MRRKYAVVVREREEEYGYTVWVGVDSVHTSLLSAKARGLELNTSIQEASRKVKDALEKQDCFMDTADYVVQIIQVTKSSMAQLFADDWDTVKRERQWNKELKKEK